MRLTARVYSFLIVVSCSVCLSRLIGTTVGKTLPRNITCVAVVVAVVVVIVVVVVYCAAVEIECLRAVAEGVLKGGIRP